jgi:TonB family protein
VNRLQKKCVIATAAGHLLLLVILFFGPAFFWRQPEPENLPMLKVLPTTAVDEALNSGVASPKPPPSAPTQIQSAPPEPAPPVTRPMEKPTEPVQEPVKEPVVEPKPVEPKVDKPAPPDDTPAEEPSPAPKPKPKRVLDPDELKPVIHRTKKTHADKSVEEDAEAEQADRAAEHRRLAALRAISGLRDKLSTSTDVEIQGSGNESFANYGQIVVSVYQKAWILPGGDDGDAKPKVHVVIARDGTVISARISEPSGDPDMDASVQRALDRVTFIQPFPDGAKEEKRSFNIYFNPVSKRMSG